MVLAVVAGGTGGATGGSDDTDGGKDAAADGALKEGEEEEAGEVERNIKRMLLCISRIKGWAGRGSGREVSVRRQKVKGGRSAGGVRAGVIDGGRAVDIFELGTWVAAVVGDSFGRWSSFVASLVVPDFLLVNANFRFGSPVLVVDRRL